ncbi:organic radical activating enzymes [Pelotomaculum thermopropionicum SI]|uniref:Anaerobic ribonucleoside-triphosphate reductase-activating protein n=1 Tax=Pelotomaculum thermopropionicum (strain DSM 13744 / JCM 10971 / SI) TaxID=370438 RepID=A5D0B1_PELTS|nr:organic radical activating enzymes [Pelotomaculum thermopropionicum SI]
MKVKVGGFDDLNTGDALGKVAFSIFFQGCRRRCPGCHNPELQPFEGGREIDAQEIIDRIWRNRDWYEAVVFVGGEPLEQPKALEHLLKFIRGTNIEAWLYTGYSPGEIPEPIAALCDVIVAGEYRDDLKTGGFPASSNQVIIRKERPN